MFKTTKLSILLILITFLPLSSYSQFLSTCTDSDGGNNINRAGTLTLSSIFRTVTKRDFCSSGQLIEYFCNGNKIGFEIKTCPSQANCYQGACVGGTGQPIQTTPQPQPPQNPPEVICPAVCRQMYLLEQNQCRFTSCGSGCGPNSINSFPTLEECQNRITNPNPQPPQQPRKNYEGPLRFSTGPENLGNYAFELGGKSIGLKAFLGNNRYPNIKTPLGNIHYSLEINHLSDYMYQNYRYNIIDYDKDGFDDFSANDGAGDYPGRFYLFKGITKTISAQQSLPAIGISINMNSDYSKFHFWKDLDKDGYDDLLLAKQPVFLKIT